MVITLYSIRFSSNCRAVLMTAKHLNIDLNVINVGTKDLKRKDSEFIKLSPAHSVPTLVHDDFVLWDSQAIMQYLCNEFAPDSSLYPTEPKKRALVDRWLNFDITLFNSLLDLFAQQVYGITVSEDKVNVYENNLKLMDQLIGDKQYLTGDELTIADLSLLATTSNLDLGDLVFDLDLYPNIKRWIKCTRSELIYFNEINMFDNKEFQQNIAILKARIAAKNPK